MFKRFITCVAVMLFCSSLQAYQIKQSTTAQPLVFFMVDSADHVSGKTGLTLTVTLSKAGGSFASAAGSVTEIANGWYKVAGNATDSNTLGPLLLHATGTGADPTDVAYEIVAFDPQDSVRAGLTALPNAAANATGGVPVLDANGNVQADIEAIDDDTTAPQNMESFYDGTGYGPMVARTTIASIVSQTVVTLTGVTGGNANTYVGSLVCIRNHSNPLEVKYAEITAYNSSNDQFTIKVLGGATYTIATSNYVDILPPQTLGALALTSGKIDTDAIGSAQVASTAVTEIAGGSADAVWDEDRGSHIAAGTFGQGVASVQGNLTGSVASVTDKTGFRLSAQGVDDIWDEAQSGHSTAGTFGKYLDIASSTISTAGLTNASIADAVWDELVADHATTGTFGAGVKLASGSITSSTIASGAITSTGIAANAITSTQIANSAFAATKFANDYWVKMQANSGVLCTTTVSGVSSQTLLNVSGLGIEDVSYLVGSVAAIYDSSSGDSAPSLRTVASYEGSTGQLQLDSGPDFTVATGDIIRFYPSSEYVRRMGAKLPSKNYLAGTSNSDGDVQLDEATGALPANSITASSIATDAIGASEIAADAIDASEIAADAIGASEVAANAITSSELADNAITANKLATDAITASKIAADAIGSSEIAADAIGSSEIATDAIGASEIAASAIGSSELASNAITPAKMSRDAILTMSSMGSTAIVSVAGNVYSVGNDFINAASGNDSVKGMLAVAYDLNDLQGVEVRQITGNDDTSITVNSAFSAQIDSGDTIYVMPGSVTEAQILAKLPSKSYLAGTNNSDGDIQLNEATGSLASGAITSTSFASGAIDASAIASNAITNAKIADNAISAAKIASNAITSTQIAANAITSSQIASNAITSSQIANGAIVNAKFASGAISSTTFASGAITSTAIAADAIGASQIAADAIGSSEIAADAIGASEIAADAIGSSEIAADAIGASEIAADAIGSSEIAASAIGSSELATGCLTSDEVSSTFLQSYFLVNSGSTYAASVAGSVVKETGTASSVALTGATFEFTTDSVNQIAAGVWDLATSGHTGAGSFGAQAKTQLDAILDDTGTSGVVLANSAISSGKFASGAITASTFASGAIDAAAIATDAIGANEIAADAIGASEIAAGGASEIGVATWDTATSGHVSSGTFGAQAKTVLDTAASNISTLNTDWTDGGRLDVILDARASQSSVSTASSNVSSILTTTNKLDTALEQDGLVYRLTTNALEQAPSVSAGTIADAVWDEAQSGHTTSGTFGKYLDAQMTTGVLGGTGSIADAVWDEALSGHTTTGTFGAGVKLQDGSIVAATIGSNAITSAKIATDAIGASQIAANAITSAELADGAITANKLASDTITAAKIADDAIDASEIAADSIGASEIAANAITTSEFADGTITANKIASNAITSAKIATDAITAAQIASGAIGTTEISSSILGASFNSATDSLEALRDRMDVSPAVGTAGGGTLSAKIADSTLSPKKRLEIVGGEQKTITLITEANGRFNSATPTDITIKVKDAAGTTITKSNASVTRVTEEADIQVDRITLTPSETTSLRAGYVTVEINVDGQKAILTTSLFIIAGL